MGSAVLDPGFHFAPEPDFRYVCLEPIRAGQFGVVATALGLGAGVTLAMSGLDAGHALFAGALASIMSALALRGAGAGSGARPAGASAPASVRMAIVPWGVLVEAEGAPRILRWAAVRRVDVETTLPGFSFSGPPHPPAGSSRVVVDTGRERFVGEAAYVVSLGRLVRHLEAYTREQATPLALDLRVRGGPPAPMAPIAEASEPSFERLLASARAWLESAEAATMLDLPPAGYRRASAHTPSRGAIAVLRGVLGDRASQPADPRAFAAVVAAELGADELVPELLALTQSPHPLVAAVTRQAARRLARKLAATREREEREERERREGRERDAARAGTLDEVAPFLWDRDRQALEVWA